MGQARDGGGPYGFREHILAGLDLEEIEVRPQGGERRSKAHRHGSLGW